MTSKSDFFYFKLVSGFLGLCKAKLNGFSRTNPDTFTLSFLYAFFSVDTMCVNKREVTVYTNEHIK